MYAKSFIALDGNGRLTGARNAQTVPYDHYTCHLCGSTLQYHPEYDTERPWFEHTASGLTENGQHHCPYVNPDASEVRMVKRLQHLVPDSRPRVRHSDWHCTACGVDYHGERYCLNCHTGKYSTELDLLITVNGRTLFPEEGDYSAPRWYIDVVDMMDAVYLMLTLNAEMGMKQNILHLRS